MIISNIVIENFRCYYGSTALDFNTEGKITLIWGDSGYGKSSFLQFFRWMFYNDPDFGPNNDMPLFNIQKHAECKPGDRIKVFGQVDFEHMGIKYSLTKSISFGYAFKPSNCQIVGQLLRLEILEDDNWVQYKGDIPNKINSILPIGLSKFFLLDGEKSRDIVLNAKELRKAIHSLFGLDAYANAISHIGGPNKKNSVLGQYSSQMSAKMTTKNKTNISPVALQEHLQDMDSSIDLFEKQKEDLSDQLETLSSERDTLLKTIGQISNKESLKREIELSRKAIKDNEKKIAEIKEKIGDLFRKNYPYLFLSRLTTYSSSVLRDKNKSLSLQYSNVFEHLKKDLLKEILSKGTCVCGRELDDHTRETISDIIHIMPPDSYDYRYKQFVSKAKKNIHIADSEILNYDSLVAQISKIEAENANLEKSINDRLEDIKRLGESQELVDRYHEIDSQISRLNNEKEIIASKIATTKSKYGELDRALKKLQKDDAVAAEYSERIAFFEELSRLLKHWKAQMEEEVKNTLNECVRDTFDKLTTQTELDPQRIQFINDDFSLRTTFLTGGQQAVDVYSYVIGIVEALQKFKMESNETPIIVDAPFAFTGDEQSIHIFNTLPTVSKQTILLTLDLNKIRYCLKDKDMYEFFVIKDETNDKATIERGDISDFDV